MSGNRKIIVLRAFVKGPHSVEEIVEETEVSMSSVYRIINALIAEGSLQRQQGRRYVFTTYGRKRYAGQLEN